MGFGFMSKELASFGKYSNKYLGYNRISEDIAIAALKSDAHYRNIARLMNTTSSRMRSTSAMRWVEMSRVESGLKLVRMVWMM